MAEISRKVALSPVRRPRLGGVDLTGNLSARSAERDVRGPGGAPGIQLLLADTKDATTGETATGDGRLRFGAATQASQEPTTHT